MKKLAKVLSLALVLVMVLSLGGAAWADTDKTYPINEDAGFTITINLNPSDKGFHAYYAYQIFKGTLRQVEATTASEYQNIDGTVSTSKAGTKTLHDIEWGNGINSGELISHIISQEPLNTLFSGLSSSSTAADFAEKLSGATAEQARAFANVAANYVSTPAAHKDSVKYESTNTTSVELEVGTPGYYLITDSVAPIASDTEKPAAFSANILQVLDNVTMETKTMVPSSKKEVQDTNDSYAKNSTANSADYDADGQKWKDTADYDVNDIVPYKLTATIPLDKYNLYDWYKLIFWDDMCAGLTYQTSPRATVTIKQVDNSGEVVNEKTHTFEMNATADSSKTSAYTDPNGSVYKWDLGDIMTNTDTSAIAAKSNIQTGATAIVVEVNYKAQLNENAVIGLPGNPNTQYIEFSNNPNDEEETGETPKDTNIVFTYKLVVDKEDDKHNPLSGAGFTLYKMIESKDGENSSTYSWTAVSALTADPVYAEATVANAEAFAAGKFYLKSGTAYTLATAYDATETYYIIEKYEAEWLRIDDGVYKISETTVPANYKKAADVQFEVTADHSLDTVSQPVLELKVYDGQWNETQNRFDRTGVTTVLHVDSDNGKIDTVFINTTGTTLPSTGGVGTTLFYVFGSMLVIAAAVYFVTKKRSEVE